MEFIRDRAGDTERIKLLKDALRASARAALDTETSTRRWWNNAESISPANTAPIGKAGVRASSAVARPMSLAELLSFMDRTDSSIMHIAEGTEISPLLRDCGGRIDSFRSRLSSSEHNLSLAPQKHSTNEASDICIVRRPEEAARADRSRLEKAAARAVDANARFKELDDLEAIIDKSSGIEGLRSARSASGSRVFPPRSQHHPNCMLLTDYRMRQPEAFKSAMWRKDVTNLQDDPLEAHMAGSRRSLFPITDLKRSRRVRVEASRPQD